jgi:hypothetical protein
VSELKEQIASLSGKKGAKKPADSPKKLNVDSLKQQLAKAEARLHTLTVTKRNKDDNKTVALGTSKINYMDPRITVAWCKRVDMPLEKIFNKSLQQKVRGGWVGGWGATDARDCGASRRAARAAVSLGHGGAAQLEVLRGAREKCHKAPYGSTRCSDCRRSSQSLRPLHISRGAHEGAAAVAAAGGGGGGGGARGRPRCGGCARGGGRARRAGAALLCRVGDEWKLRFAFVGRRVALWRGLARAISIGVCVVLVCDRGVVGVAGRVRRV